jgi:hypothetical protein
MISQCFLAGIPSSTSWSHVFTHSFSEHIHVGFVFSLSGMNEDEMRAQGKQFIDACVGFSQHPSITPDEFISFLQSLPIAQHSLVAYGLFPDRLVLASANASRIWLSRGGQEGIVMEGKQSLQFVQGNVIPNDYYILGTHEFFSVFASSFDTQKPPQELCDTCAMRLHTLPETGAIAGLFLQWKPVGQQSSGITATPYAKEQTNKGEQEGVVPTPTPRSIPRLSLKLPKLPSLPFSLQMPQFKMNKRERTKRLIIAGIFVVLFGMLLLFRVIAVRQQSAKIQSEITPLQAQLQQIETAGGMRGETIIALKSLQSQIEAKKKEAKNDRSLLQAFSSLSSQVQQSYDRLSGEKHISKLQTFYDFRLVAPDFVANEEGFDPEGKLAVFLDGNHSRLLSLSLEKKEPTVLSVDEKLSHPLSLSVEDRKAYVLADNGVMRLSLPLDQMGEVVVSKEESWQSPKLVGTFGTNLYVLDTGARNLFKYDLSDSNSKGTGWFRSKEGIDFDTLSSLQIDGEVWLGTTQGQILRFSQGSKASFSYSHVPDPPSTTISLFVPQEKDVVYVLEPRTKRLLILNKSGEYQGAIFSDDLGTATSLIVDSEGENAYVLAGSLVYLIPLTP